MGLLFGFNGSIGRAKFAIIFFTSLTIYSLAALLITQRDVLFMLLRVIIMLTALVSYVSVIIRRMHDIGRKSVEIFLLFIPIYGLYILFLLFFKKGSSSEQ